MSQYSEYLNVTSSGRIWWRLQDAIRIVAGFSPDSKSGGTELVATNNHQRARERSLLSAFHAKVSLVSAPGKFVRDGEAFVQAREFLSWFGQYLLANEVNFDFPAELARAVDSAENSHRGGERYSRLHPRLADYYDQPLDALPKPLAIRTRKEMFPFNWEDLSPEQRRCWAIEWDATHDPALEGIRTFWWNFFVRKSELKRSIEAWEQKSAKDAIGLKTKEDRLRQLRAELAGLDNSVEEISRREQRLTKRIEDRADKGRERKSEDFVPFPVAQSFLESELNATFADIVMWIFRGSDDGGLTVVTSPEGDDPPDHFHFRALGPQIDLRAQLVGRYMLRAEITHFKPRDRYIGWSEVVEQLDSLTRGHTKAFVHSRIAEGKLAALHPITGISEVESEHGVPLEESFFDVTQVTALENELRPMSVERTAPYGIGKPVASTDVIEAFAKVPNDPGANAEWWANKFRDAKRVAGLLECRASGGSPGKRGSSTWYPGAIANWLYSRKHMRARQIADSLDEHFPECADIAEMIRGD